MSDLDYVESLSNKELRNMCIQHGLPNVPVTDSSRRLLIRRLRTAMDGPAPVRPVQQKKNSPKKPARKTLHVSKPQNDYQKVYNTVVMEDDFSEDDILITATKGAPAKRTIVATNPFRVQEGRSQPKLYPVLDDLRRAATEDQTVRIIPMTVEGGYGGARRPPLGSSQYSSSGIAELPRSRSVSLSKTEVLSTSYRHETAAAQRAQQEDQYDDRHDEDDEDFGGGKDWGVYSARTAQNRTQMLPHFEPVFAHRSAPQNTRVEVPRSRSVSLSKSGVLTTSYRQETTPVRTFAEEYEVDETESEQEEDEEEEIEEPASVFETRKVDYQNYNAPPLPRPYALNASASRYSPLSSGNNHSVPAINRSYNNSFTTASPLSSTLNTAFKTRREGGAKVYEADEDSEDEDDDDEDVEEIVDSSDDALEGSYNSQFARKLQNRKSAAAHRSPAVIKRAPIAKGVDDVDASLQQVLTTLDRKFHLKQSFAMVLVFALAVFLYVVFTP